MYISKDVTGTLRSSTHGHEPIIVDGNIRNRQHEEPRNGEQ